MRVAYQLSNNVLSNLGRSTSDAMDRVLRGEGGLRLVESFEGCESVCASLLDNVGWNGKAEGHTRFEQMAIISIEAAAAQANIELGGSNVLFVLSTTKGNVELLERNEPHTSQRLMLWYSAERITRYFGNPNPAVVVSNACISGVSALIAAQRYLLDGAYEYAVVVGCDRVTKFVVSGFQSFKALSGEPCKPFDKNRTGLNLGEAAATMILGCKELSELPAGTTYIDSGAITNDANHISAPSRTARGLLKAIELCNTDGVGFVVAHGTATPYNDQMEALALVESGFGTLPVLSLKGYFGHTLGTAGVLETIVGCELLARKTVARCLGYSQGEELNSVCATKSNVSVETKAFLKTISGFGGCNAALVIRER